MASPARSWKRQVSMSWPTPCNTWQPTNKPATSLAKPPPTGPRTTAHGRPRSIISRLRMNGDLQQPSVRIALVTLGDVHDPGSYSGLPHGLYSSLVDLG